MHQTSRLLDEGDDKQSLTSIDQGGSDHRRLVSLLLIGTHKLVLPIGRKTQIYLATCSERWHVPFAQLVLFSSTSECTLTSRRCWEFSLYVQAYCRTGGYHRQLLFLDQ